MSDRRTKSVRRRRAAFWVLFTILVLGGVGAGAVLLGSNDSGTSSNVNGSTNGGSSSQDGNGSATTTTVAGTLPAFHSFKVTDGVNVRSGPGTTYPVLGTVETGFEVLVVCVIDGENVPGPVGASNKWLRVMYNELNGYVTSLYVATGTAINDPSVIGVCKSL
jgi:hypothetical protein